MLGRRTVQRGDTIVEVLFAITIFSMVAVAAVALMNSGLAMAQRSLEITTVRQQIDGQAEALRFLHSSYIEANSRGAVAVGATPAGQYAKILAEHTGTNASAFGGDTCPTSSPSRSFAVNPRDARVVTANVAIPAQVSAQLTYNELGAYKAAEGLWIEAVRSAKAAAGGVGYVDFHVRACWPAPGQTVPMSIGTIVRLYDPQN